MKRVWMSGGDVGGVVCVEVIIPLGYWRSGKTSLDVYCSYDRKEYKELLKF